MKCVSVAHHRYRLFQNLKLCSKYVESQSFFGAITPLRAIADRDIESEQRQIDHL